MQTNKCSCAPIQLSLWTLTCKFYKILTCYKILIFFWISPQLLKDVKTIPHSQTLKKQVPGCSLPTTTQGTNTHTSCPCSCQMISSVSVKENPLRWYVCVKKREKRGRECVGLVFCLAIILYAVLCAEVGMGVIFCLLAPQLNSFHPHLLFLLSRINATLSQEPLWDLLSSKQLCPLCFISQNSSTYYLNAEK